MEKITIKATNKDGKPAEYDAIAKYTDEETKKNYILYTDNSLNEEGSLNVYSSLYEEPNGKMKLIEIIDEEDIEIAQQMLDQILEDFKKDNLWLSFSYD